MPSKRKPRRGPGSELAPAKTAKILELLFAGHTLNQVAKQTGSNWVTVRAVQWANTTKIDERKRLLAERSEHAASDALDILHSKLLSGGNKIKASALVPIFGVLVDKSIALRQDPTIYVQHQHSHIHAHISEATTQDIISRLRQREQSQSNCNDENLGTTLPG